MTNPLTIAASIALAIDTIDELDVYLFAIAPGAKFPPCEKDNLSDNATKDPEVIKAKAIKWARNGVGPNWGIALKKSNKFVADVDVNPTKAKVGQQSYADLEDAYGWPATYTVETPSGGRHLYYEGEHVFALGQNGRGIGPDIDSPNYVLIAGCVFKDGTSYRVTDNSPLAPAPQWLYDRIKDAKKDRLERADEAAVELDKPEYEKWAIDYLQNDAEPSIEGKGGEQTTYKIACSLRDNGISQAKALELMLEYYNIEFVCEPLWETDDLARKIGNAYAYANLSMLGGKTAEADFSDAADDAASVDAITTASPEKIAEGKKERLKTKEGKKRQLNGIQIADKFVFIGGLNRWVDKNNTSNMWKNEQIDNMYRTPKEKKSSLASLLLASNMISKFETGGFLPGKPQDCFPMFNFYTPSEILPVEGDTTWWDEHLAYLFPIESERNHVLNWMAWLIQNLGEKPKHALLVQGHIQGTGKSFLSDMLAQILNPANVYPLAEDDLHNQFNGWAIRSKLLVIEELRAVERATVKSKLHTIITQERISVNEKNLPQREVQNCFGIFGMTNDDAAVAIDNTDRRYLVVRTDAIPRDKLEYGEGYDPKYYDRLYARLRNSVDIAAVAYVLMNRDLKGYDARNKAPETAAKNEMIKAGMNDVERFVLDAKVEYPLNGRVVSIQDVMDALPKRLERTGRLHSTLASLIKKHCDAVEAGQFTLPNKLRPRLYFINKTGLQNMLDWRERIVSIYELDKQKAGKTSGTTEEPSAADDFGIGGDD